ncbi:acyl-CoA dehydrogenase [Novosphingobium taihuense]|nr:acyl-CoA dehydrogenase [Novosphingobium taihuense]
MAEVRESIRTVLDERCTSLAVHAFIDGKASVDQDLRELAKDLGWLAISLPEAHGGIGLGANGLAVLNYELGRAAAPGSIIATSVALETLARSEVSADPAIAELIVSIVEGTTSLAIATSFNTPHADGAIRLIGDASANVALIPGEGDDLLLADLSNAVADQVVIWDETRSILSLPSSSMKALAVLRGSRPVLFALYAIAIAADSAGAARGTLDRTIAYMKQREQFGRLIGSFQALKHRLADHQVNAKGCDELVWQAAEQFDNGAKGALMWSLMAKANVTDAALRIAGDCVQLHGGVGFTREYDPHLFLKRAWLNEALLAPNGALRDKAASAFGEALKNGHEVLEIA